MSINIGDNFSYLGKKFLDDREHFDTVAKMKACNDVPNGFITYCDETNTRYEYHSDNQDDVVLGRWRVFKSVPDVNFDEYVTQDEFNELELIETSPTEPTDEDVVIWINTSEDTPTDVIARINDDTVASNTVWSSEKVDNTLDKYATKTYVSSEIAKAQLEGGEIDLSGYATKDDIPTKVSELTNDSGFLTSIPNEYVTDGELNDKGYLTEHQNISHLANKSDVPTKTSQLTNDSGFLTSVPSEYVTDSELNNKGYATTNYVDDAVESVDVTSQLSDYAKKSELHSHSNKSVLDGITSTKITEWDNKSTFSGNYSDLTNKPTIPTVPTNISAFNNDSGYLTNIPSEYVTDSELTAKGYATEDYVDDVIGDVSYTEISDVVPTNENVDIWINPTTSEELNIAVLDDSVTSEISTWSSSKIDTELKNIDVSSQLDDYVTKDELTAKNYAKTGHTHSQYATTSQLQNLASGSNVPTYVIEEAQMVGDKVIEKRNAYSLVITAMSDLHTTGSDTSATSVLHAFQGINEIDKVTPVDLVAIHGDVIVQKMDDTYKDGLKYVRTCMNEVTKNIPLVHMQGNHDELNTDSTEEARQKYFRYIGANNVDVTTDFGNRFRNYGYKDFDDLRIRFIYLNSADLSDFEQTGDLWITPMQYNWFINKALDFSNKEGAEDWQWIVACHHPLNWSTPVSNLQLILKAYTKKTTGSFTFTDPVEGSSTISYDFTNVKQKLICHVHGHIHNFRTEWFDDVLSVTVPNACFGRNNEYGTAYGDGSWAQITGGDPDEHGVQRQFNKTSNSANDTAFVTFVIDSRVNNKIYAYCYGAGIDREIDLVSKEVTYISKKEEVNTDEIPNEVLQYDNSVPTSIDSDGSIYNGTGYKDNTYISTSNGLPSDSNGFVTTGYMELPNTFYVYGATMDVADSYCRIATYDSSFTKKTVLPGHSYADYFVVTDMGNGIQKIEIINSSLKEYDYIRLTFKGTGENLYIYSMNEDTGEDTPTSQGNLLPKAIDTDGSIYNEVGFKIGWRLSGSTGLAKEDVSFALTGYIPFTCGDVIRMANILITGTEHYVWTYDSEFNPISVVDISKVPSVVGDTSVTWDKINQTELHANAKYIRISIQGTMTSNTIITINEEITGGIITPTPAPELFTNLVPTSIGTDGNIYNGTGYKADYRGNSSGTETALDGAIVSGFIPYNNEVIKVYGSFNSNHSAVGYYVNFYDSSFTHLVTIPGGSGLEEVEGYYLWTLDPSSTNETQQSKISQAKYIRASMPNCEPSNFAVGLEHHD